MSKQLQITAGEVQIDAELNDTAAAIAVSDSLSIIVETNIWGAEIYLGIPVDTELAYR